jgi:hypothetical protein
MDLRQKFEEWAKTQSRLFLCPWFDSAAFADQLNGKYCNNSVEYAWQAWLQSKKTADEPTTKGTR